MPNFRRLSIILCPLQGRFKVTYFFVTPRRVYYIFNSAVNILEARIRTQMPLCHRKKYIFFNFIQHFNELLILKFILLLDVPKINV